MTNVEVKYGGEAYTVIGRDIDDVQAEIDDILARRSHGWLTAYDGRGIRAPYRLLIAEGVSVSLALAARDE